METYHKIQTVFKRDPKTKYKTLLLGEYSTPEFKYLSNVGWYYTEKVDGTNIRVVIADGKITIGGKTDNAQIPGFLVARLQEIFNPLTEELLDTFADGACLYGEGFGPKIQKGGGRYGAKCDFALFDIKVGGIWLERHNVESVAVDLGLPVVPKVGFGTLPHMVDKAREGFESAWGNFPAEGIVARPAIELLDRRGHRIITKIKYRDFQ